uniref:membrane-spanning 4-domains subfamily A member 4A-like n=1 Tax=Monopterus albus TaxID=43700 RepID=UPI0009B38BE6|nr:membrane-spanning 4-domains subfamily A member 4A-like [Monopterus albus]XP_020474511.1 membrane-spanning 4-domains subfamily A member 4A-like [Monopterus albus]
MTSTSITTVGGVRIVTQVIPKDETSIVLQSATQNDLPPAPTSPAKTDDMRDAVLRGEPQGLGVVQIFIGLLCILFSLTAVFSRALMAHVPFGLAITFVVSGSLAMAAGRRTSVGLVWASLVSNVISVMIGLVGVAYVCWLLAVRVVSKQICGTGASIYSYDWENPCIRSIQYLDEIMYGLHGILLVLLVLQVCVSITMCVLSGRELRHHNLYSPVRVKVDGSGPLMSSAVHSSNVTLLGHEGE